MKNILSGPDRYLYVKREWEVICAHRTPLRVQRYLRSLEYNFEDDMKSCRSFRSVVRDGKAHCLEGALTAAAILEHHGYPPLLVSIESQDLIDHVLYAFRVNGCYGAVARSRDLGLHGRKPVYRSIRDLVLSYFEPYIDKTGRITAYALADLRDIRNSEWRFSTRNVWKVERYLQEISHTPIKSSDARYESWHRRYLDFKARYPDRQPTYYSGRSEWLI